MYIDENTLVYTQNYCITGIEDISDDPVSDDYEYNYDEEDNDYYDGGSDDWILEFVTEPIIKNKSKDSFVLVPVKEVVKRINKYEKIMSNTEYEIYNPEILGVEEGSIYEIILDLNNLKKQIQY